jgi:hypothetical protein
MGRLFDGTCHICGDTYDGRGISSHIKRCLADQANKGAVHHGLLVSLRADGVAARYWTYVLLRPEAKLHEFDRFLRDHWMESDEGDELERPSVFEIERTHYMSDPKLAEAAAAEAEEEAEQEEDDQEDEPQEDPIEFDDMEIDVGAVLRPRMEATYRYDPHQPTAVEMKIHDPFPLPTSLVDDDVDPMVVTLAENTLEGLECTNCGEPADWYAIAGEDQGVVFLCDACRRDAEAEVQPLPETPRS